MKQVRIKKDLHKRLKKKALDKEIDLQTLACSIVEEWLKEEEGE